MPAGPTPSWPGRVRIMWCPGSVDDMAIVERTPRLAATLGLAAGLLALAPLPARAVGERFEAAKEEPATTYGRRFNWAHARPNYYSTTQHGDEDPRLDETRDPDGSYLGTATARLEGLPPGLYEVWLFYRRSNNRSRCAPWAVEADGDPATACGHVVPGPTAASWATRP
jgi:hypothetical protein